MLSLLDVEIFLFASFFDYFHSLLLLYYFADVHFDFMPRYFMFSSSFRHTLSLFISRHADFFADDCRRCRDAAIFASPFMPSAFRYAAAAFAAMMFSPYAMPA